MKRFTCAASWLCFFCCLGLVSSAAYAAPVLMISVDGLRPDAITQAADHGLNVPNLLRFIQQGSYAEGVNGVQPTVTYPNHTTILTGVLPAEHGILNNLIFDPARQFHAGWYWYASDIRVPTLWDAARQAGLRTASVSWPVSIEAPVDTLIPEIGPFTSDNIKFIHALSRPQGIIQQTGKAAGPYMNGTETGIEYDQIDTRYAIEILRAQKPDFFTLHLVSLDGAEHQHGPFSPEANHTLEAIDLLIGQLVQAATAVRPDTVVAIVSDHGFAPVSYKVNVNLPFIEAGLMQVGKSATGELVVTSWEAAPWLADGSAAVVLREPSDAKLRQRVSDLLQKLIANPQAGVARIVEEKEIRELGAFPNASFVIAFKEGYLASEALSGDLVVPAPGQGTHGYWVDYPNLRASFFIMGKGIAQGRNLGVIDMRQIAPTVARILNAPLPTAKSVPLTIAP